MSDQAVIIRDDARLAVSFSQEALALKERALEVGALIGRVTDAMEQNAAVAAQTELQKILALAEKARKAVKAPIIDYGRKIDAAAEKFTDELKAEMLRISRLVADYQQLEAARVRAAEQARLAEAAKLEAERRAAELAAFREAELQKQRLDAEAAELARNQAEAKNAEDRARCEVARLELERQQALAQAASHEQLDRINEQHAQAVADLPVAAPVRAEGQRVREEWAITVTDIWLLAKAHPVCVKIEPRLSEIKQLLDAGVKVAGVTAKREIKAGVTGGRLRPAIDV
jgi:hypothetical protein